MRAIVGVLFLGLIGCGGGETETTPASPGGTTADSVAAPVTPAQEAPVGEVDEVAAETSAIGTASRPAPPEPEQAAAEDVLEPASAASSVPESDDPDPTAEPETMAAEPETTSEATDAPPDAPDVEPPVEPDVEPPVEPEPRGPVTYTLDSGQSFLAVLIRYDRGALIAGHDHGAQAMRFTGSVTWDPDDLSACNVVISFPVTALAIDPPGLRERMGLKGSTSAGDISKIEKNMLGKHQLESSRFPEITFQSTRCRAAGARVAVEGTLGMHGVSRTVTASMTITENGEVFRGVGGFAIKGSSWGIDPYTAALGALKNDDALAFTIDVAGIAR